jgi:spore coat polysaccharide biosynthesis protein SpsF
MMKIGFLITARLKSSRLPFKVLMDLNGKTVIERIIDRAKMIQEISEIVVCTSTNPQDKPLVDLAKKNNVFYFNGSEEDVLQRLLDAAHFFDLDYFIGITADNPLFSIHYSNRIVDVLKQKNPDYVKVSGLPFGTATYGLKVKVLEVICKIKTIVDTEIWGSLVDRPDVFDIETIKVDDMLNHPKYRFTLDYLEDYQLINHIYSNLNFDKVVNLYDLMDYLENHPDISKINVDCVQKTLDEKLKRKIDKNYEENIEEIKKIKKEIMG